MSKATLSKVLGNMLNAILKYNRTRISMRDELGKLLEEENNILRKKTELLFRNLCEYEEIIEEETLGNIVPSEKELTVDLLSKMFDDGTSKPLEKSSIDALGPLWTEKRMRVNSLLTNYDDLEKQTILKTALTEATKPEDFMQSVIGQIYKLQNQARQDRIKRVELAEDKELIKVPAGKNVISEAVEVYEGLKTVPKKEEGETVNVDLKEQFERDLKKRKTVDDVLNEKAEEDKD